jgi:hypothetical protein
LAETARNLRFPHLHVVVRVDDFATGSVEDRLSLVSAFASAEAARTEAERLAGLPTARESRYVVMITRLKDELGDS